MVTYLVWNGEGNGLKRCWLTCGWEWKISKMELNLGHRGITIFETDLDPVRSSYSTSPTLRGKPRISKELKRCPTIAEFITCQGR